MTSTPGPWIVEVQKYGSCVGANGVCIATSHGNAAITGFQLPHEENAMLISAAPDMLNALRHARGIVAENCHGIYEVGVLEDIDAAISKAITKETDDSSLD